jgi:alanine dehydrogenase
VTVLDTSLRALRRAEEMFGRVVVTEVSHVFAIARAVSYADVLIGAVLARGERAPQVVTRAMVGTMKRGAVIVDLSIDQGGCVETSRPTTLEDPVYVEEGVIHYAVPNMGSAVARTASLALTYAALPFVETLAGLGIEEALGREPGLARGVYVHRGELVSPRVAKAFDLRAAALPALLGRAARVAVVPRRDAS